MTWSQLIKIAVMGILRFDGKLTCERDNICRVAKKKTFACEFKIKRNVFSHIWLYWTFLLGLYQKSGYSCNVEDSDKICHEACIAFDHMLHQLHLSRFY